MPTEFNAHSNWSGINKAPGHDDHLPLKKAQAARDRAARDRLDDEQRLAERLRQAHEARLRIQDLFTDPETGREHESDPGISS